MSFLRKITGAVDPWVSVFTKRLQARRGLQIGPKQCSPRVFLPSWGSLQLATLCLPEAAIARALKEWKTLIRWELDSQLSVMESRVFGSKYVHPDHITSVEEWLEWRIPLAFPSHQIIPANGWTSEFFSWAVSQAREN